MLNMGQDSGRETGKDGRSEGIIEGRWDLKLLGRTWLPSIMEALPSRSTHCPRSGPWTICVMEEWGCALCLSRRGDCRKTIFN